MAICNTFNKLTKPTGNFLAFSQYANDLTRWDTEGNYYRVVPSSFMALNVDFVNKLNNILTEPVGDLNIDVPRFFQNIFENSCAFCANKANESKEGDINYNSNTAKSLFWHAMISSGLLTKGDPIDPTNSTIFNIPEIKYVGDISIQNYENVDGFGYSDVYCYIPNEAKCLADYKVNIVDGESITNDNQFIEGYTDKDKLTLDGVINTNETSITYYPNYSFTNDSNSDSNDKQFDINTIIVFYDVYKYDVKNQENSLSPIYKDIPMGIYFPGNFDSSNKMTNTITKYVSNSDAYDAGTSYGLRICSRFLVSPNNVLPSITVEPNTDYASYSQVMSAFADTYGQLKQLMNSTIKNLNCNNDMYNYYKNGSTNVPYVKNIGTEQEKNLYWFVNGKLMAPVYNGDNSGVEAYIEDDVTDALKKWEEQSTPTE